MLNLSKNQPQRQKKLKFISSLIFSSLLFPAFGSKDPMLVLISIQQKKFSFHLSSNPTTGYRWKVLDYDHQKIQYLNVKYIAKQPQLMGSGGYEKFYFKKLIDGPIDCSIQMTYQRPWEKQKGSIKTIKISTKTP